MTTSSPPHIISEDSIKKDAENSLRAIDELDLGNLLNEETERTRNAFLFISFTNCVVSLLNLKKFQILGQDISFENTENFLVFFLLLCVSFLLGDSYKTNYESDLISKSARREIFKVKTELITEELNKKKEKARKSLKDAVNRNAPDDMVSKFRTTVYGIETTATKFGEKFSDLNFEFERQRLRVQSKVKFVLYGALAAQIACFVVGSAYSKPIAPSESEMNSWEIKFHLSIGR